MNQHNVTPFRRPLEAMDRSEIVRIMAGYLVAEIMHNSLDTSRDQDVIQALLNTPERFQSRVVLNHMDEALAEAKQILIAREISEG